MMNNNLWYTYKASEVLEKLNTNAETGLSNDDALRRLEEHGKNMLKQKKTTSGFLLFLAQFNQPLVYILVIASVITALLKEVIDSARVLDKFYIPTRYTNGLQDLIPAEIYLHFLPR